MERVHSNNFRAKFIKEMRRYWLYAIFFMLLLSAFTDYERLLMAGTGDSIYPFGYSILEALILAKVIIIGEWFDWGNRYANRSLIYPVLYKTIFFTFLMLIFSVLEHFLLGLIKGRTLVELYASLMDKSLNIILAKTLIMFFIFGLFFSFLELSRVLGQGKLFDLFFRRK